MTALIGTIGADRGLRTSGPCALALLDGATNGERFRDYVRDTLTRSCGPAIRSSSTTSGPTR